MTTELAILILKIVSDIAFMASMGTPATSDMTQEQKIATLKGLQGQTNELFANLVAMAQKPA